MYTLRSTSRTTDTDRDTIATITIFEWMTVSMWPAVCVSVFAREKKALTIFVHMVPEVDEHIDLPVERTGQMKFQQGSQRAPVHGSCEILFETMHYISSESIPNSSFKN